MDLATQEEDINPMAPNSEDTSGSNVAATITSSQRHKPPASFAPSQPVFSRAAPGEQFQSPRPKSSCLDSGTASQMFLANLFYNFILDLHPPPLCSSLEGPRLVLPLH